MESVGRGETARRQIGHPRRHHAFLEYRRASRADRRAHRPLCASSRARECHSRRRLWLCQLCLNLRSASERRLGQVAAARRRRPPREPGIVAQGRLTAGGGDVPLLNRIWRVMACLLLSAVVTARTYGASGADPKLIAVANEARPVSAAGNWFYVRPRACPQPSGAAEVAAIEGPPR